MEVLLRHGVLVIPFEKMSCLVTLRTGMLREPDHRTPRYTPLAPEWAGDGYPTN
jgi:hypothetical protein